MGVVQCTTPFFFSPRFVETAEPDDGCYSNPAAALSVNTLAARM